MTLGGWLRQYQESRWHSPLADGDEIRRLMETARDTVQRLEEAKKVSQETMRTFIGPGLRR